MAAQRLQECVSTFQTHMHLPDPGVLEITLATVIANRTAGDPVWLLIIGPPGGGKTETLGPIIAAPDCHAVATLTEASLLSGTPKREVSGDSTGGLLRSIGRSGTIVCKDFGSVLSMHRDARAGVLAALREIYDGSWTRHVGSDGGRTLHWHGRIGLIAASTPVIDRHHAVIGSMGERFVFYRLPRIDADAQARTALRRTSDVAGMRDELARAAMRVLESADGPTGRPSEAPGEDLFINLSSLAARCRSSVERDGTSREVEHVSEPEAPARLALVLRQLWLGLRAIGAQRDRADHLIVKTALDSMPAQRRTVLTLLLRASAPVTVASMAESLEISKSATRRVLEDLGILGIAAQSDSQPGGGFSWAPSEWTRQHWGPVSEVFGVGSGATGMAIRGTAAAVAAHDEPDISETQVGDGLVPYPLTAADWVLATDLPEEAESDHVNSNSLEVTYAKEAPAPTVR